MSFACARFARTGFDTVGFASGFSGSTSSGGTIAVWTWMLNPDGTVSASNSGFVGASNASPGSWGLPATSGEGANWEASVQITSGNVSETQSGAGMSILCKDSDGSGGVAFGIGSITPQTTPWFSLDVARDLVSASFSSGPGGTGSITLSGTVFVRHKVTRQQFSASINLNLAQ